jgi:hypothetical protein
MGKWSRNKGARWEVELGHILEPLWPGAKRGIGQARSAKEVSDVQGTPFWIEAKHQQRCNIRGAFQQATAATDGRPVVVITKDDRCPPLVTMALTDWMRWIRPNVGD